MRRNVFIAIWAVLATSSALVLFAQDKKKTNEHERDVTAADVPPAAMAAIKKLAGGADITKYEEEIENGDKFYEASWKTPSGKMEVLVTASGDLVATEEGVSADSVPAPVLAATKAEAGEGTELRFEKVNVIRYEAKFMKDGAKQKLHLSPTGKKIKAED